jgi:hypothetical protein
MFGCFYVAVVHSKREPIVNAEYVGTHRDNSAASYDIHRYKEDALAMHGDADFYKGAHRKFGW